MILPCVLGVDEAKEQYCLPCTGGGRGWSPVGGRYYLVASVIIFLECIKVCHFFSPFFKWHKICLCSPGWPWDPSFLPQPPKVRNPRPVPSFPVSSLVSQRLQPTMNHKLIIVGFFFFFNLTFYFSLRNFTDTVWKHPKLLWKTRCGNSCGFQQTH